MRKALTDLRRFIVAKDNDEERGEIREYVTANAVDLAHAFGVNVASFETGIASVDDDARLARRLLAEVKRAERENRTSRTAERLRTAQESADVLGSFAAWEGDGATIDIVSVLASVLTSRSDSLVLVSDGFTITVPMGRLFDLARLERVDLRAHVDSEGLHVRWATGGLNFRSAKPDPKASTIFVHLPRAIARAA